MSKKKTNDKNAQKTNDKPVNNNRYTRKNSIVNTQDDYSLSEHEYYLLYSFFVTYSMCPNQSCKKKSFTEYGWKSENIIEKNENGEKSKTDLGNALSKILDFNSNYLFLSSNNHIRESFSKLNLSDGQLQDFDFERSVIGYTSCQNRYLKLFYRVRDALSHGNFALKYSTNNEKMVILEDHDTHGVTARIVIKLSTLLAFIDIIDKNGIIAPKEKRQKIQGSLVA